MPDTRSASRSSTTTGCSSAALTEWIRSAADDIDMVAAVPTWPELLTHPEFPVDVVLLDLDLKDNIPVSLKISTLKTTGVAGRAR